jgi:hypothetical protein
VPKHGFQTARADPYAPTRTRAKPQVPAVDPARSASGISPPLTRPAGVGGRRFGKAAVARNAATALPETDGRPRIWWAGLDLNQRTALAGQVYSLVPLTTRPPTHDGDSRKYGGHRSRSSSNTGALEQFDERRAAGISMLAADRSGVHQSLTIHTVCSEHFFE